MEQYKKLLNTLRSYLIGFKFNNALKALEFAQTYHKGFRKDKVTPEFQHQVEIALYILTLPEVHELENVLAATFLHDVREDYNVPDEILVELFGKRVAEIVDLLTKVFDGVKVPEQVYFSRIENDISASIVKGSDRIHNLQSMVGVFNRRKQEEYLNEVKFLFLPMLKYARRKFPEQTFAYYNIEHMLKSQVELIEAIHEGEWREREAII